MHLIEHTFECFCKSKCLCTLTYLSCVAFTPCADAESNALQAPATVRGPDSSGPS